MSNPPLKVPTCYATCSIGTPTTPLPSKLSAIASAGFQSIELSFPDLLNFAKSHHKRDDIAENDYDSLCTAGKEVKKLCEEKGLKILVLQPFSNFEGWAEGSPERKDAFERAEGWIRIMEAVGTDMLQKKATASTDSSIPPTNPSPYIKVGSSDSPSITSSPSLLASDLSLLADLLARHNFRLAYENWCWATHAPTWRSVYDIITLANRPNIGLCLDTFQTAGSEWADPTTASGLIESESTSLSPQDLASQFRNSLKELSKTIPADKIYFLQISDAYKMHPPLDKTADEQGLRPRGRWSHDWRPLPFNGGYLPVVEVARAVLETGFRGPFSMEVFDGKERGEMGEVAQKAMRMHERLMEEVGIAI